MMCEHEWEQQGCRICPKGFYEVTCCQNVYQCKKCGEYDYGFEGGPGWNQCKDCDGSLEKVEHIFIGAHVETLGEKGKTQIRPLWGYV